MTRPILPAPAAPSTQRTLGAHAAPPLDALAGWLLDHTRPRPPAELLRCMNLGGYAYAADPAERGTHSAFRPDFLNALARHERIKQELLPLLRAWNAAGIEPLLFKGFHLAEFVYPAPGMRFHGDVDILVPREQSSTAIGVTVRLGWTAIDMHAAHYHNVCSLNGPAGAASIDLHRWLLHALLPFTAVQRRITEDCHRASVVREWEGVRIRELAPVDALLVGLVLQRCWSGDRWHLKAHDALDFRQLAERYEITLEALDARARELRATRTLSLFLERCHPSAGRLRLNPPALSECRRWERAVRGERSPLGERELLFLRILRIPAATVDVAATLPSLIAAHRAMRRTSDMPSMVRALAATRRATPGARARHVRYVRGIRWGARLFPRNTQGDCVLRSLALFAKLRSEGWPARFVSGVRRDTHGVVGHAWVELDGRVLPELGEPHNRQLYAVNFEYPPAPGVGTAQETLLERERSTAQLEA